MNLPLVFFLAGLIAAAVAFACMVVWRQPEVTVRRLLWSGSDAAVHPERFVDTRHLTAIRLLNLLAAALLLLGVGLLVAKAAAWS
jgi:hypothetical protein